MFELYRELIVTPGKQALFFLFVAFIVTFLFIRASVRMIRAEVRWWPGNITTGDVHVHHMVFGTVLMFVAGLMAFAPIGWDSPWWEILGAAFGVGAALVLDEFALILHLDDVYWSERGRTSVDAVVLAAAVMGLLVLGVLPFGINETDMAGADARLTFLTSVFVTGGLVGVALVKGRIWLGVLGLLLPLLALIGAVRLAKPHSPWARWRYPAGSRKRTVATARALRHDARWERLKHRVFDAVAGSPTVTPPTRGGDPGPSTADREGARADT